MAAPIQGRARPPLPRRAALSAGLVIALSLLGVPSSAIKPTDYFRLQDLEQAPSMTPEKFAELFERFFYEFNRRVLRPEDFLWQRAGDCDDYAILSAHILGLKGYKTRLIQVQLAGDNVDHAVSYVTDRNVYLDYNNRKLRQKLVKSQPSVREVAGLVAASFEKNWTTAFEFTYTYTEPWKKPRWVIVKTDPPERDADRQPDPQKGQPRP